MITFEQIKSNPTIITYISQADESLYALGFTEHNFTHVLKVADTARYIMDTLNYSERTIELVQIAAYMHDIGNMINRVDHAHSGGILAFNILTGLGMEPMEIAAISSAIGNHDESTAVVVTPITAALILSDKTDIRRSRVRSHNTDVYNIHNRVNYAAIECFTRINDDHTIFELELTIDTKYCSVMDYFEIFLTRMLLCRRACEKLELVFHLVINGQQLV